MTKACRHCGELYDDPSPRNHRIYCDKCRYRKDYDDKPRSKKKAEMARYELFGFSKKFIKENNLM